MKIITVSPDGFASNSYIVTADGKNAIIIDCAQPKVYKACEQLALTPVAVFLTHGHYDHIGGCGEFYKNSVPIYCGNGEEKLIFSDANRAIFHDITIPEFKIDRLLCDNERINLCGIEIRVIATSGHTAGGVCYEIGDNLFSGDTLFYRSVGRTDLQTGDDAELIKSVKKLYALEGDRKVYCGHGNTTSLDDERRYNPYIRQC